MAFARGRTRLTYLGILGSAALAVALGGCSSAAGPVKAVTSAEHSLTIAQAQAAYRSYVTASTAAAKQGDATQGLAIVADGQFSIMHAQYRALTTTGTPVPQYRYGTPTFYVPALSSYPQWFVVTVPVTTATGARQAPAVNTVMAFERSAPDEQWTLNGSAVLEQPLPAIARDGDGYAINVSTKDTSLLLPPDVVGATQAAVVDEDPPRRPPRRSPTDRRPPACTPRRPRSVTPTPRRACPTSGCSRGPRCRSSTCAPPTAGPSSSTPCT